MLACGSFLRNGGTPVEEVTSLPRLKTLEEDGRISETPEVPPAAAPAPMKESGATFTFKLPDNTSKEVVFRAKPLGLDFSKSTPLVVKAVKKDSVAEDVAVQSQWEVTHVNGEEMPTDLREAMTVLLKAVKDLPPK
eukprot:g17527.t1